MPGESGAVQLADVPAPAAGNALSETDPAAGAGDPIDALYLVRAVTAGGYPSAVSNRVAPHAQALSPGWNLIAWPLLVPNTSLDAVLGRQLHGADSPETADSVLAWHPAAQSYQMAWFCACIIVWGRITIAQTHLNSGLREAYPASHPPSCRKWIKSSLEYVGEIKRYQMHALLVMHAKTLLKRKRT